MARKDRNATDGASRRDLLKGIAMAAAAAPLLSGAAAAQTTGARPAAPRGPHRILVKGGTIVSMDDKIGDLAQGDVLIEGKKIAAIAPSLTAADAETIDASNTIVVPGFVDSHRHSWEGQLRRINPNAGSIEEYSAATHRAFAPHYRPHDMYVGNLITALGCIDSGITCVIDNSHNSRSAAHSDEAIRALFDSGIRAVHASGAPLAGEWDRQWPGDLDRLKTQFFASNDQLVTLRMFAGPNRELWAIARRLGLRITTEFTGPQMAKLMEPFFADKLAGPDNTFNHCGGLPPDTWESIREAGVTVDVCPRSDSQYGLGEGIPAYQKALDHGVKPGFSVDNETSYSTDMFMEMRVAFHIQRAMVTNRRFNVEDQIPPMVSTRDVLACATVNGAACAGLIDKIGTLTPGKEADLVMIRTDAVNLYPSNNAIGTIVAAADRSNIDTVIIGGQIRKRHGQLVGFKFESFRKMVDESRDYLFEKAGYKPDLFAPSFKL